MTQPGEVSAINSHACMAAVIVEQGHEIKELRAALQGLISQTRAAFKTQEVEDAMDLGAVLAIADEVLKKPRP